MNYIRAQEGPVRTIKTTISKDLTSDHGKTGGIFNCSYQMDYQTMAGIFKGLTASGSWGYFDEYRSQTKLGCCANKPRILILCYTNLIYQQY